MKDAAYHLLYWLDFVDFESRVNSLWHLVKLLDMVAAVHYYFDLVDRMLAKNATPLDFRPNCEVYVASSNDICPFHFEAQREMYHVLELLCQ